MEGKQEDDDSKSHREAKIEVFSEDEDDYGDDEDACDLKDAGYCFFSNYPLSQKKFPLCGNRIAIVITA